VSVRTSPILSASGEPFVVSASGRGPAQYESMPLWMQSSRHWESGETTRLNEAHWAYAASSDMSINDWLTAQLTEIRFRSIYETRQNGDLTGIVGTLCDDVVGQDGPTLEVQSDNDVYNEAAEEVWRQWFAAPTFRPNWSGATVLRMWVGNLPRCGEFLAQISTDQQATGPVKMRLRPRHSREMKSPTTAAADGTYVLGVQFEDEYLDRPLRYWIEKPTRGGYSVEVEPWPAEDVIHEFLPEEEKQARGYPWFTPSLQPVADLRDYDDQVQDAARLMADQACLLYNRDPDEAWATPEETTFTRRSIKMAPPGWEPFTMNAAQPPVQYPDYRKERMRQISRPIRMPLMIANADSSGHNYSSARFDAQSWDRFVKIVQLFLSGTERSAGVLNRLLDLVCAEARFSVPELRTRPKKVTYQWTWPVRPHVDKQKEAAGTETDLRNLVTTLTDEYAYRGKTLDTVVNTAVREIKKFSDKGLEHPYYKSKEQQTQPKQNATNQPQGANANG